MIHPTHFMAVLAAATRIAGRIIHRLPIWRRIRYNSIIRSWSSQRNNRIIITSNKE